MFRLGGFLSKVNLTQGYVVLNNGNLSWSVQLKNSIFFEKMSFIDFKRQLKKAYDKKYKNKILKLQTEINKLKNALKEIKKKYKKNINIYIVYNDFINILLLLMENIFHIENIFNTFEIYIY